jgi:FHA domain
MQQECGVAASGEQKMSMVRSTLFRHVAAAEHKDTDASRAGCVNERGTNTMRPHWPVTATLFAMMFFLSAGPQVSHAIERKLSATTTSDAGFVIGNVMRSRVFPVAEPVFLSGAAEEIRASFMSWLRESYGRAPALVLGLGLVVVIPPLALLGLLLKRQVVQSPEATVLRSRGRRRPEADRDEPGLTERGPAWPSEAWLEVDGSEKFAIGRGIVRIGRESDNDICLSDKTVHRYHAAVHRTEDAEFVITDLSSVEGNGVSVNGRRLTRARLEDGDEIELGLARLAFIARPT